jgi:hypothetical protein
MPGGGAIAGRGTGTLTGITIYRLFSHIDLQEIYVYVEATPMRFYRLLPLVHVYDFSRVNTRLAVFATRLSRLRVQ